MKNNTALKIFLVDDDKFCLSLYQLHLSNLGYNDVSLYNTGVECLNDLTIQPDVIFLDYNMDLYNGLDVLKKIKRFNPDIYVVFLSGQENLETAVNSLKYGAFDYLVKNDDVQQNIAKTLFKINQVKKMISKPKPGIFKKIFSSF
jgi:DNA-binding NtrC family response regulator